ncbi:MAG TPA: hypothetical protein VGH27_06485 [Streptosporangiaceae bacterium]|jgi:flavin reductase (DIM6/NTAB) family NADH-FMN oxidoreductase RutF
MSAATDTSESAEVTAGHAAITPSILYFGTPIVLLSTENQNGSANLAPMSSAWALGQVIVLGLGDDSLRARNLPPATSSSSRPRC